MEAKQAVMPGDVLATEEEYIPGANAYVENGHIYAAVEGVVSIESGIISVKNAERNVSPIKEGMYVLGLVTDDMRTVQFVKIDDIHVGSQRFVATKNGKLIAPRRREGDNSNPRKDSIAGDVILARVDSDKEDTYVLDLYGDELGVVHANCEICGKALEYAGERGKLRCSRCKRGEYRNTSAYYDEPVKIEEEIGQHALNPVKRQRSQFRSSRPPFRRGGFRDGAREGGERGGYRGSTDRGDRSRSGGYGRSERYGSGSRSESDGGDAR